MIGDEVYILENIDFAILISGVVHAKLLSDIQDNRITIYNGEKFLTIY